MDQLDIKLIARLAGYGRVQEATQEEYPVDFMTPASRGDAADHNQTNNMGDNPMKDPSALDEDNLNERAITPMMISKLHHILNNIGIHDSDIAMGDYEMDADKAQKVIKASTGLNLRPEVAQAKIQYMCNEIGKRLMDKGEPAMAEQEELDEFQDIPVGSRFSYVVDPLANVMVYDGEAGTAVELKGEDAVELLGALEFAQGDDAKIQEILSQYQHVMEDMPGNAANQEFASAGTMAGLKSLEQDIGNMRNKLKAMTQKAKATGDVQASFAAEIFSSELDQFEHNLKDYLDKIQ